ncbi:hypothetical protein OGR47_15235 [Methylocystis sp. MJC1]|jgi:hypothetical protein|uniref:hypothetical protein n=1 Tax=Methylocystis sp. MJC1 TaxID=2654282 RepID=UPI0013EB2174|nr:hypothetical protein [Methylocystis sp. MJC1]KAF2989921.1 hypothetical protein MJC1_03059 [Methylocystis sp. MJC1]MBU6528311.1 hypothetical protein [Methylocystis sp. MJC1]UZX11217.1 hypothetical protein OGR47_15235 [Methylocystis sp. MJC1]
MKLNWLHLIVSAMLVIAALSGAAPSYAGPALHPCAAMTAMDDCPDHSANHATAPRRCDSLICGAVQLTPPFALVATTTVATAPARRILDDADYRGLSTPPDLRPPIL